MRGRSYDGDFHYILLFNGVFYFFFFKWPHLATLVTGGCKIDQQIFQKNLKIPLDSQNIHIITSLFRLK